MDNHPTFWKTHAKKFYITIGTLSVAFVLGGMMVIPLFDNRQSVLSDIVDNNPTLPSLAGTFESSEILGFEYLDSGAVIHVWNTFDDYYFNNTRMEQFSNHYEEYWTKNIFKLVYDKNGVWETIFRSDTDLVSDYNVSFNCVSDSFINITVSGNISWKQYDIHLGVHYYIEPWDENLTVVPFAKNIGSKDISETLGLAWEMQNIQINNDTSNNFFYLQQNASYWNDYDLHNSSLDNSYDNLTYWYIDNHTTNHWGWKPRAIFWIRNGNESNWFNKQLYLDWNETLDYELVVKHETGQYNSPVTLFITGGTLLQGEQKSYQLQWYDADVTWGTPVTMASNNPYQARCKSIYDSSIVTVFIDEGNSYGYAGWANVTGNTVWPYDTTEILLSQDVIMGAKYYPLNQLDIASIDYNTAVVAYIDDSDDDGWARIMNIDWTPTVSANQTSPVEFEDTDTEHITMCKINDSAVLIVYDNEGLSDDLTCVIGHVSESLGDGLNYRDTLTFETPVSHPTNTYWPMYCDVALLDNRQGDEDIYQAICIFSANDEADDAYACVINITGTTATWGAITQISAWNSLSNAICVPYPDTAVGVISDGNVYPMKITGSTISVGTPADIGAVSYPVAITALNATCVVAGTEVSSYGRSYMGTVTWGSNTISLGSGEIFDYNDVGSATWLSLDMCTIGNNKTVVVYLDEDNLRFEGNAGYGPNVDNPPTFSGESPVNTSTGIALQPTVYVVVDDQNWHGGETLTCDWYTSTNGVDWTWRQTNSSVLTDTNISYDYTQASSSETKYYWRIWANDGIFNRSDTYEFTTIPGTWQNITSISGVFQNTSILPPEITLVSPLNQTGNINETVTIVSIVEPDNQDYTVTWYSNYSDGVTWEAYDIVDYTSDGYCHAVNYNFTGYDTTYWWNVSVTDENGYTNESGKFWFNTSDDTISYYCRENINQHLYGGPNAVYATVHNQANADSLQNLLGVGQQEGAGIYLIYRSPLIFNTTTIGSGYTISNAYLNLYGYSGIAHEYFEITIQYNDTFTYPSLTTVLSDYNMNHYIGNGGYINSSDFIVNQYISITLSASGRNSMMNKTGITRFILRSNEDINSSPPPNLDMNVVTFEDAGDDNKSRIPKLRITRTIAGEAWQNITSISGIFSNSSQWNNITSISGIFSNTSEWLNTTSISGIFTNITIFNNITSISGVFTNSSSWNNISSLSGLFSNSSNWINISSISGVFTNTSSWNNITSLSGIFTNETLDIWQNITSISGIFSNSSQWNNITSISGIFSNASDFYNITSISGSFSNSSSWNNISSISGIFSNSTNWINITSISGLFSNSSNWLNITSISGTFSNTTVDTWQNITSISGIFTNNTQHNNITSISGLFSNSTIYSNITSISGAFTNVSSWLNITSISGIFQNSTEAVWQNISSISGIFTNTTSYHNISSISGVFLNTSSWINVTSISGVFTNVSNWQNITSISGVFTNTTVDLTPPTIINNFTGNLTGYGGPYDLPPYEGSGKYAPDGYYTNDSRQSDDWMYINITASDDESTVTNVWLQWLNETTWNNWTYAFTNTVDDRWEINTSGIIQTHEGYNYSFNIVANSSGGTKTHVWRKPTPGSAYLRRYVQLNCTRVNVTYFPLYLVDNTPQTTEYGAVDVNKADRLHHDQGADTTITDTGYLNSTIPDDIVRDRYCSSFTGNYFEDSVATSLSLNNIYYHTWVSQGEELGSNISFEFWESRDYLKLYFDCTAPARRNWDTTNYTFNRSEIYYDNDLPAEYSDTYYLLTGTINTTNTSIKFNDNNIYELVFVVLSRTYNDPTPDNHYPAVMSNRSFTSFVLLNVPSNETLNASHPDTDSDTLSDWQELYQTYTNPFLSDTDNDGINDYWENQAGSDPNNYTETFNVSEAWQNITSISGVFQNTTAHNNITSISGIFSNTSSWQNITSISGTFTNTTTSVWQNISSISGVFTNSTSWYNISSISGQFTNTSNWQNISSISGIFQNTTIATFQNITSISGIFTNSSIWTNISSISGIFTNTSTYHNITSASGIFTNTSIWNNITSISGVFTNITTETYQNITSISGVFINSSIWNNITSISGIFSNTSSWLNITSISGVFSNTTTAVWNNITSISGTFSNTSNWINITSISGIFQNTTVAIYQNITSISGIFQNTTNYQNISSISGVFLNTSSWNNITSISGLFSNTTHWNNITSISGIFTNTTVAVFQNITSISGTFSNTSNWINITSISGVFSNSSNWLNVTSISGVFSNTSSWYNITSISGIFSNTTTSVWQNITSISGIFTNTSNWYNITSISGIFSNTSSWSNITSISGIFSNQSVFNNITSISGIFTNTTAPWNNITSISGIFTNTTIPWNNITSISGIFTNTTIIHIIISNPYPSNTSVNIPLQPIIYVTLNSTTGQTMNITWYYGLTQGSETIPLGTDTLFTNSTQTELFHIANTRSTWYYWRIQVDDGTHHINDSFYFRTEGYPGGGGYVMPTGGTIGYIGIFGLVGFIIILIYLFKRKKENNDEEEYH